MQGGRTGQCNANGRECQCFLRTVNPSDKKGTAEVLGQAGAVAGAPGLSCAKEADPLSGFCPSGQKSVQNSPEDPPCRGQGVKERNVSRLKDQILKSARQLFRERGYDGVSLRAIAEHAGTTIGNLTYHYPQKGDLLVAMQLSAQVDALTHIGNLPPTPDDVLRELMVMCHMTELVCSRSSFCFCNMLQLCKDIPVLKMHVAKTRGIVFELYVERFIALKKLGYMRADLPDGIYESVVTSFLMGATSWLNVRLLFDDKASQASLQQTMTNLLQTLLTAEGRAAFQRIEEHMDEHLRVAIEQMDDIM